MTNDIEILDRIGKLEEQLAEIKAILLGRSRTDVEVARAIVEDVICPPDFPDNENYGNR